MKKPPCSPSPVEQDPLQKAGFRNNDEWEELLARANQQIQTLEGLEEGEIKDTVFSLLNDLDAIHREALTRLVALFKDGVLEQVVTDPAIHTLMEIYGLAGDFPEPGEMTTGPVPADNVSPIPVADNYVFNKPLPVVAPIQKAAGASAFPRWVPVLAGKHALKSGKAQLLVVDDQPMYIALVEDDLFAIDAHCFINGQLMAGAELNGYTLSCPLHAGCHYDVRQGSRLAAPGSIDCFPIKINDSGNILIGFEMPFTPHLPTF